MSEHRPIASGRLAKTPLGNLIIYLLDRELNGTLVLETSDGGKSAVSFIRGVPAKVRTAEPVIYLGRLLVEQGLIDEDAEARSLTRLVKEQRLHGQLLVEAGHISREDLIKALQEQVTRKLEWLFGLPGETAYGFYQDTDFLQGFGGEPTPIRPLAALWRGVRRHGPDAVVEQALERLGDRALRFHPDAAIKKFGLSAAESSVVDVVRAKPQPLSSLMATGLLDPVKVQRLFYCLLISRHLDLGEGSGDPIGGDAGPASSQRPEYEPPPRAAASSRTRPPHVASASGPTTPRPDARPADARPADARPADARPADARPRQSDPDLERIREEITERHAQVDSQNYYEILGVPEGVSTAVIQAAFFQLAKRFHPDKIGGQLPELREQVNKLFSRISEAHQVLSDETQRGEYERLMREGGASHDEQEKVQVVLRAAQNFQKAEVLLKKRDLKGAAEFAKKAADEDPEQADYLALYAWVTSQLPERLESTNFDDLLKLLDRCVALEPDNVRCRWYRGQLHKRAGDDRKAIKDFRWVLEKNPKHVDAMREVRLYEMRRQTSAPKGASGAGTKSTSSSPPGKGLNSDIGQIWGKLFKRDK